MTNLQVLEISRQNQQDELSPWLNGVLDAFILDGTFLEEHEISYLGNVIVEKLRNYKDQTGVGTALIGMSGGVDSALTGALLKRAGWKVIGVTMPIKQNPDETDRGIEACKALGFEHINIDLTSLYYSTTQELSDIDDEINANNQEKAVLIRRGNIKARLRMITLYNLAAKYGGLVASTDNYSELAVGFWTLHGDVGDLSPIQALTKSWEVPILAKLVGVPESIWKAKPTDGLGVDDGDEAQFGFSYLELDLMLLSLGNVHMNGLIDDSLQAKVGFTSAHVLEVLGIGDDEKAVMVFNTLLDRMGSTWFKRMNPVNIEHPLEPGRYAALDAIDRDLFHPPVVKR